MHSSRQLIERARVLAFGVVRRGPREVLWTPPTVRAGNVFYFWLRASTLQHNGVDARALENASAAEWIEAVPTARALSIKRTDVGLTDRRVMPGTLQRFGEDFNAHDLDRFITEHMLAPGTPLSEAVSRAAGNYDLTVNVRRGDYYSVPRWRGEYSFDVVEYVRSAIRDVQTKAPVSRIHVVSDDLEWCRIKLGWLNEIAEVTFPTHRSTAIEHLATLAASPRLILTNSTFSYWGGYLAEWRTRNAENMEPNGVWAPAFHNRFFSDGGRATQLHPHWHVVEDIPGGWDG